MMQDYKVGSHPALGSFSLKQKKLPNRLVVAPMSRASAEKDGTPTSEMAEYYAQFAKGGFGMIITEGVYPDEEFGIGYANQPGIITDNHLAGWGKTVKSVGKYESLLIMQLMHAGALSQYHEKTISPSGIIPHGRTLGVYEGPEKYRVPFKIMSKKEINNVTEQFKLAALRAEKIGFHGIEVHGANGYLLDQFATTYTNLRDDEYGGTAENRIRFTAEVVAAIRQAVSPEFIVGVRISQSKVNDEIYRWTGIDEATVFYTALEYAGADYLHIASEGLDFRKASDLGGISTTKLAKQVTHIPIIANGGMHDESLSAELIEQEEADLVSIARWALANPDYPKKLSQSLPAIDFQIGMILPKATITITKDWFLKNNSNLKST